LKNKYHAELLTTDDIAKRQMEPGGASYLAVVDYFGKEILASDGTIDRPKLANIIFEDDTKRLKINEITHPIVLEEVLQVINEHRIKAKTPYLVVETALMIEAGYDFICDEVWYVYAPEEERRARLIRERNYSIEKIESIIKNQCKDEDFRAKFSLVIENDGDYFRLEQQVDQLLQKV
jgi:dephospho-CoA kinase